MTAAKERMVYLGFVDESFPEGTHMCYIFNDDDERRRLMGKFLKSGLSAGERVGYSSDTITPDELIASLEALGVPAKDLLGDQLHVSEAETTYCDDNGFNPERMLSKLRNFYTHSLDCGFCGARITGEMSWALRKPGCEEKLLAYERDVGALLKEFPVTAICQYDARLFGGAALFEAICVHPLLLVRGQVVKNPWCT